MTDYSSPSSKTRRRDEALTASAHLRISLTKFESDLTVPAAQSQGMIATIASLTGLVIMAVICPLVTLREGLHALSPDWRESLVVCELAAGIVLAALPYLRAVSSQAKHPGRHR